MFLIDDVALGTGVARLGNPAPVPPTDPHFAHSTPLKNGSHWHRSVKNNFSSLYHQPLLECWSVEYFTLNLDRLNLKTHSTVTTFHLW